MRFKIFIIYIIIIYTKGFSNDITFQKTIHWSTQLKDSSLIFEGAVKQDTISNLPYFLESMELSGNGLLSVSNIQYIDCPVNLSSKIKFLSDSIKVKQFIGLTRNKYQFSYSFLPIIFDETNKRVLLVKSFTVKVINIGTIRSSKISPKYAAHSVLSDGKWIKTKLKEDGIYKIPFSQLKKWFEKPENVRVYGKGDGILPVDINLGRKDDLQEISTYIYTGSDGTFGEGDYILFLGQSPNIWVYDKNSNRYRHKQHIFSEYSYYYLTDGKGNGNRISTIAEPQELHEININTFDDYGYIESDEVNFLKSGSEWYGDRLASQVPKKFSFKFPNLVESEKAYAYLNIVSKSTTTGVMTFTLGNFSKKYSIFGSSTEYIVAYDKSDTLLFNASGSVIDLNVEYVNNTDGDAAGYINYFGVNVVRKLIYDGSQMRFRNKKSLITGKVVKYEIENVNSNCQVWDITDIYNPFIVPIHFNNTQLFFTANNDTLRQYIIFNNNGDFKSPITDGNAEVENQDIHGNETPNLIIVAPNDTSILRQAKRLADFRKSKNGLKVLLVTTQQVYNEFSGGKRDVTAIRDMVKMFYDRDKETMKYLLLFGKGTFANHIDKKSNYNLIPTYESIESLDANKSYVTDDFFGWMSSAQKEYENLIDVGVGRLPVKNGNEAEAVVNKLINYENPKYDSDWRNTICFIADDQDNDKYITQSESLAKKLESIYPEFVIQKIYLDSYVQIKTSVGDRYPDARTAINNRVNNGLLIVNYIGHGSENQLAHEDVIDVESIRSWNNKYKLPLFITATCEFSRFDNVNLQEQKEMTSGGEEILLNPDGGSIGLMTTTRLVYADDNYDLNVSFYNHSFTKDENGDYYKLGDLFRLAKNDVALTGINRLNFTLLGDPSMVLGNPKNNGIETDSINGNFSLQTDTINALSLVEVKGHIKNASNLNGQLYVSVFDKVDTLETLANDPENSSKISFSSRQNIIFKGLANIENGCFSFDFPVPKDIKYSMGKGKIVYYATNGSDNYSGSFSNFIVGGINDKAVINYTGPDIRLFMNDTNFRNNGITNSSPRLLAKLFDNDGINATGSGIGHDITAVVDNNISQVYILNDYYINDLDEYKKGTILFPFTNLEMGKHTVNLVAWDIYNNQTEATLHFEVLGNDEMIIKQVYNFPNPMRNETNFVLEHNWPEIDISLEIQIYSFSGGIVNTLNYRGTSAGYRTAPIKWDGMDKNGHRAGKGIYIYRAIMTDKIGNTAENHGKIVIVR
jgi:hypothetical protein